MKQVRCISNDNFDGTKLPFTIGKVYDTFKKEGYVLDYIKTDSGGDWILTQCDIDFGRFEEVHEFANIDPQPKKLLEIGINIPEDCMICGVGISLCKECKDTIRAMKKMIKSVKE